ncbi:hypothetical protein G9A89_000816 [Geosiphon pyriformis]|nr:hypothetical protein G9A89_000816 [Geosiphon pyriformis]
MSIASTAELKANYAQAINLVMNRSSDLDSKLKTILSELLINNTAINILTANILNSNTHNISALTNLNTTTKLTLKQNPKAKNNTTKLKIGNSSPSTNLQFFNPTIRILTAEFGYWETNYNQTPTNNIPPATVMEDELFTAIFPFEIKELLEISLFSRAALKEKPIIAIYTNAKIDNHSIKLILDSELAGSIITRQLMDQLETNEYYSNAQILDQFIARLKDKLIKKVHPHAPENLATAIQQVKNYKIAMEEANHTKLVNLAIGETSSAAEEKIDQLTKKVENYFTNQQQQQQPQQSQQPQRYQPLQ